MIASVSDSNKMGYYLDLLDHVIIAVLFIQLVRLALADADLSVLWYEHFGKKPDVLAGNVVWITGASSGIGEYLAYDLAKASCRLVLSARRKDELERVKQQCLVHGRVKDEDILVLPIDLLAYDSHAAAVKQVLDKFQRIDILVNNGGRAQIGWTTETELQVDKEIMDLNYLGTVSLTKAVLPHMINRKQGHIVVSSSLAGKSANPFTASYTGSKFALHGWFNTLRVEQSPNNIRVSLICPGPVQSNISENSYTSTSGATFGKSDIFKRMSTERCTELMVVAMVNKLDEVWISKHPALIGVYFVQYLPEITKFFAKRYGMKMIMKYRSGK